MTGPDISSVTLIVGDWRCSCISSDACVHGHQGGWTDLDGAFGRQGVDDVAGLVDGQVNELTAVARVELDNNESGSE